MSVNHDKIILNNHCYPVMKNSHPDGSTAIRTETLRFLSTGNKGPEPVSAFQCPVHKARFILSWFAKVQVEELEWPA